VSGRFWQGRFSSVKLCDEAAVLACVAYVDLNPIRAGLAETPEASDFTSVQRRIESLQCATDESLAAAAADPPDAWLAPIALEEGTVAPGPQVSTGDRRASDKGFLPMTLAEYVEVLEWTGRQIVFGRGSIPAQLPPIFERLGIASTDWLRLVRDFGRLFHRVAGAPHTLARMTHRINFRPGRAQLLGRT